MGHRLTCQHQIPEMHLFGGLSKNDQLQNTDTGLVYLRARWYNPSTGTFLGRDPFDGFATMPYSQHLYQYGYSSPLMNTDPTGKWVQCLPTVLLAAADGPLPFGDWVTMTCLTAALGSAAGVAGGAASMGPSLNKCADILSDLWSGIRSTGSPLPAPQTVRDASPAPFPLMPTGYEHVFPRPHTVVRPPLTTPGFTPPPQFELPGTSLEPFVLPIALSSMSTRHQGQVSSPQCNLASARILLGRTCKDETPISDEQLEELIIKGTLINALANKPGAEARPHWVALNEDGTITDPTFVQNYSAYTGIDFYDSRFNMIKPYDTFEKGEHDILMDILLEVMLHNKP